ncbi:MAG: M81 family metallopeptidase [Gammaproteobacteria bacterium]|nr:M81 family metallopeptidase [Gammaproteobacteria bacterium]MDH3447529.1 M81 family metallopeptidase [Gammaproteobacteria bacterium]
MTYKILSAEFMHETNTFSRLKTDEQAFRNCYFLTGSDAIARRGELNTELAGFLDTAGHHGWQVDHVLSAGAGPGGTVTRAAFEWLSNPIVEAATSGNHDGILLGLHGAMVTDFCEDGEGELLSRLRAVIGDDRPIAITLDLHANVTEKMCALADIIVSYKTYPHVDMRDRGRQAAEILQRRLHGEINPRTIRVGCPMLEEVNGGRTDIGPMIDWIAAARDWEQRDDVFAVSINGGFASADIAAAGPSVLVTAEGDLQPHREFAFAIASDIWRHRHDVLNDYLDVETAAAIAAGFNPEYGPLVIADYADNPGAGSYGDATSLLRALLDAGAADACFGPMVDGATVQKLQQHRHGDQVEVSLGGKVDPDFGGGPLKLRAELISLSDGGYVGGGAMIGGLQRSFGPTAVIRVDGIEILVTTLAQQLLDLQQFKSFGIDPAAKRIVALKSMQHFRADFAPVAGRIIVCDSGALCTPDYRRLDYRNVARPVFPLDAELDDPALPMPARA